MAIIHRHVFALFLFLAWSTLPAVIAHVGPDTDEGQDTGLLSVTSENREEEGKLTEDYYEKRCPKAAKIVSDTVQKLFDKDPNVAGPLLRLLFHDCFVQGCDASILLDPPADGSAPDVEKNAAPNLGLGGFNSIDIIKAELEKACPGVVSCADTVAFGAREAVLKAGGPFIEIPLGRRDGFTSVKAKAEALLPAFTDHVSGLAKTFAKQGLNEHDLVLLSGGHTIGRSHCSKVANRLPPAKDDHMISPKFKEYLISKCSKASPKVDPSLNDEFFHPTTFDNQYYKDVLKGYGLFTSDAALAYSNRTRALVTRLANDQKYFFAEFSKSLIKMGNHKVLTGKKGQIRKNCRVVNSGQVEIA